MNRKTPKEIGRTPVARSNDRLLDDPGNEDPGSQLDAPVPLRPSTGAQQDWARSAITKPVVDEARFESVWAKTRALAGGYEMNPGA